MNLQFLSGNPKKGKKKKLAKRGKKSTKKKQLGRYAEGGARTSTGGAKTSTTGNRTKTGGSNPGGASTGGAGTITITTGKVPPKIINISNVGGKTAARNAGGMDPNEGDEFMSEKKRKFKKNPAQKRRSSKINNLINKNQNKLHRAHSLMKKAGSKNKMFFQSGKAPKFLYRVDEKAGMEYGKAKKMKLRKRRLKKLALGKVKSVFKSAKDGDIMAKKRRKKKVGGTKRHAKKRVKKAKKIHRRKKAKKSVKRKVHRRKKHHAKKSHVKRRKHVSKKRHVKRRKHAGKKHHVKRRKHSAGKLRKAKLVRIYAKSKRGKARKIRTIRRPRGGMLEVFLKNPIGGAMASLNKVNVHVEKATGYSLEELGMLFVAGAIIPPAQGVYNKFIAPHIAAYLPASIVSVMPTIFVAAAAAGAHSVIAKKMGEKSTAAKAASAVVAASVVYMGQQILGSTLMGAAQSAGLAGVNYTPMSGVQYTPMSGVTYTPMSGIRMSQGSGVGVLPQRSVGILPQRSMGYNSPDFGRFDTSDYGGGGGYTEGRRNSTADFGGLRDDGDAIDESPYDSEDAPGDEVYSDQMSGMA